MEEDLTIEGQPVSSLTTTEESTQPPAQFSPGKFDGPQPDLVYRVGNNFYILYELPLERLGIDDEPHYIMYTGQGVIPEYEYMAQNISQENLNNVLAVSFDSGGYEEIEGETNVIDQFYNRIERAAQSRPWIKEKETTGKNAGQYVLLSMFIEQLFEPNVTISVDEYKAESDIIKKYTQRQLDYWSAITFGGDPATNAALRKLQQQSAITVTSLLRTYAPEGLSQSAVEMLYEKSLTGEYTDAYLSEQIRYLAAPAFSSLVDSDLKAAQGDAASGTRIYDQQAKSIIQRIMGLGFLDDMGEQEFKTISQSLIDPNGARILEGQLQELWDAENPNKKGMNYALVSATPRKIVNSTIGDFDEYGEDSAFFADLINETSQVEMAKKAREYGLFKEDKKTQEQVLLSIQRSFQPKGAIRRLAAQ